MVGGRTIVPTSLPTARSVKYSSIDVAVLEKLATSLPLRLKTRGSITAGIAARGDRAADQPDGRQPATATAICKVFCSLRSSKLPKHWALVVLECVCKMTAYSRLICPRLLASSSASCPRKRRLEMLTYYSNSSIEGLYRSIQRYRAASTYITGSGDAGARSGWPLALSATSECLTAWASIL